MKIILQGECCSSSDIPIKDCYVFEDATIELEINFLDKSVIINTAQECEVSFKEFIDVFTAIVEAVKLINNT